MPGILTTPVVRNIINQFLVSDSQLEAFVLDYFPHVKHLYGNGMDRIAKVNLLLEQVSCDQIYENLCKHFPEVINRTKANIFPATQNHSNTPNEECKIRYFLVLTGTIDELDEPKIRALVSHIRRLSGDIELTLEAIKPGSIILHLKGTSEGLKCLRSAFHSGELREILGFRIENIGAGENGGDETNLLALSTSIKTEPNNSTDVLTDVMNQHESRHRSKSELKEALTRSEYDQRNLCEETVKTYPNAIARFLSMPTALGPRGRVLIACAVLGLLAAAAVIGLFGR